MTPLPLPLNACGATFDHARDAGALNAWGNTFPAEEMQFGSGVEAVGTWLPLVAKRSPGQSDHVETPDQRVALSQPCRAAALALLCCGEMGEQEVSMSIEHAGGASLRAQARAPGWLAPSGDGPRGGVLLGSHLHYPAYELDALLPALYAVRLDFPRALDVLAVGLGRNPLFHLWSAVLVA